MNKILIVMVIGALLSGCASVDSVRDAPESRGEERFYDLSYERMVDVVAKTLPLLGLEDIEKQSNDPRTTVFIGTHGITLASWGEVVRVIVTEIYLPETSVRVYWRHKFSDGIITSAPNWEEDVFAAIEERIP